MAAQYVEISLDDMEKFLKRAFRVYRPKQGQQRGEFYYDLKIGDFVGVRVWTSVGVHSGAGAGVGSDAIRVQLVSLKDHGPLDKGKAPIVKRTQGWRTNLQDLVEELIEKYDNKEDFYEPWAEFRKVPSRSEPQQQHHPRNQDDQPPEPEIEREEEAPPTPPSTPRPVSQTPQEVQLTNSTLRPGQIPTKYHNTQFRLSDAPRSISPKQLSALKRMMHKVNSSEWKQLKLDEATNFVEPPKDLSILSKLQASAAIDILKPKYGWERYAGESDEESDDAGESVTYTYERL